ncbi:MULTISPECIES: flagellar hook-associated protein 2 [Pontibacillus]|uniref:Flagellar hook-associated protein 2 n=1 Tax=Pontibacillus chungwhensis TaxID=265426 RepID=A0ABY8UZ03_9BACI|nr:MULTISPECIES: flagellar hook-associated protein 2 [Pontibacillus]MCD5325904.1 flagellar hook-associated protein 2 [Pontibacillus sp. HN14]WIF97614.1 flagellar hook-associated protein 2 [Pontibacillus chungwhensis]
MSDMRIGGLATGMDIDKIVGDLMKAERIPLNKMEQEKTWLTWQRDAYRDMNKNFDELETMASDMKFSDVYNTKTTSSTMSDAVTATADSGASNGNYSVQVKQLASAAINTSRGAITKNGETLDLNASLESQQNKFKNGIDLTNLDLTMKTYNEDGSTNDVTIDITKDMSMNDIFKKINNSDLGVRAFYNEQADQVVLERTKTGDFNQTGEFRGAEIGFQSDSANLLTQTFGVWNSKQDKDGNWVKTEVGGKDAEFVYNNALTITSHDNSYKLNGVNFQFKDVTDGKNASVTVNNNVDHAVDKITKFVAKYNEIIESANKQVSERKNRDYKPLTDKEKEAMEEKEIELWEEQAKKGLLSNDSAIEGTLFSMRNQWYESVETSGNFNTITDIGIKTSSNYRDGGKLLITESELRSALENDPESVYKLFSGEGDKKGIADKLEESLRNGMKQIEAKAGKSTSVSNNFRIGKELDSIKDEMRDFEDRLTQIEDRYWSQFTAMEKAIQKLNSQSAQLMSQFG